MYWPARRIIFSKFLVGLSVVVVLLAAITHRQVFASEPLVKLAQPGPWSAVDAIIGYGPRIWFANSELFRNHNAADIYSYDPATGSLQYERALFSQGAGRPMIAGDLLYWPFEDPRFSAGLPEFAVTNGTDWNWYVLPEGEVYHLHAMAAFNGSLYAASSSWQAHIHVSADNGATWQALYSHPTPKGRLSRIYSFATSNGRLYAGLTQRGKPGPRILRLSEEKVVQDPGWPDTQVASSLTAYRDTLFAILQGDDGRRLWRADGRGSARPVANGPAGKPLRALAAGEDAIWAITAGNGKGALWKSKDGNSWTKVQDFLDAAPVALSVYENEPYVGSIGPKRRGTLWGPRPPARVRLRGPSDPISSLPPAARRSENTERHLAALGDLAAPEGLSDREWLDQKLMPPILALARAKGTGLGSAIAARLNAEIPERLLTFYGGQVSVTTATLAKWYLLWAVAQRDGAYISPELLALPWDLPPNRPEKYFHPTPAAAWAMAQLGQGDNASLAALVARLERPGDPKWLTGDIVGALTVLTGKRFGHDYGAWQTWWAQQQ